MDGSCFPPPAGVSPLAAVRLALAPHAPFTKNAFAASARVDYRPEFLIYFTNLLEGVQLTKWPLTTLKAPSGDEKKIF